MAPPPFVDEAYSRLIDYARRYLRSLIYVNKCAHIMLRLAWHDAGTFDVNTKKGGPNGSLKNIKELNHAANAGLSDAVDFCGDVRAMIPFVTYADLFQLAGVVAVEVTGGPTIEFVPGRMDSLVSPREGNLPDATKQGSEQLKQIYYRMGLSDKDIVALSGAHSLVIFPKTMFCLDSRFKLWRVGFEDPRTKITFDNSYFLELLEGEKKGNALLHDPAFRGYVELYAKDKEAFFRDYSISHKKLSELGFTPPSTA